VEEASSLIHRSCALAASFCKQPGNTSLHPFSMFPLPEIPFCCQACTFYSSLRFSSNTICSKKTAFILFFDKLLVKKYGDIRSDDRAKRTQKPNKFIII
jgi:hypothetical protein